MTTNRDKTLHLRMIAEGLGELYPRLTDLAGLRLGDRFTLRKPCAVGGQSILFLADDCQQPSRPVLARLALLPYHRPAYITDADIRRARARIEREAVLLEQFSGRALPQAYGLFRASNPLLPVERDQNVIADEPYLVMEFIEGVTVQEYAHHLHLSKQDSTARLVKLGLAVARTVAELACTLFDAGYLYADLNPRNLIVARPPVSCRIRIRIVDAGSIIPAAPAADWEVPFSWAYLPPDYYNAYQAGHRLWPTPASLLYALGKLLWGMLTDRQPMPAEHPDLNDERLAQCPEALKEMIIELLSGRYDSFDRLCAALECLEARCPTKRYFALEREGQ